MKWWQHGIPEYILAFYDLESTDFALHYHHYNRAQLLSGTFGTEELLPEDISELHTLWALLSKLVIGNDLLDIEV